MSDIDLDSGYARFEQATDFSVGLEEEYAILDPGHLGLTQRFEELRDAARRTRFWLTIDRRRADLLGDRDPIGSWREPAAAMRSARSAPPAVPWPLPKLVLGATGTHPWADYREQRIIDTDHYHRVEDGLKYVAWRNNTFSTHVHVGVRGADRAVEVCDRLRPVLPLLLAISANSPFLEGRDAGLHSMRSQIFTKSFPRCGVPDAFGSWDAFAQYIDFLVRTRSIIEYTQVWWSIRPHLSFGTVEVRICDTQVTAAESAALTALIVACVAQAARDIDEGATRMICPHRWIEENMWRAIRYGLDGELLDLETGDAYPARAAIDRLLDWTAPMRGELGLEHRVPVGQWSAAPAGAAGQGMTLPEVYAPTVEATRATYAGSAQRTVEVN